MIEYINGDILASGEAIVVHGCNCFQNMNAGIALQVREQCPRAWTADQNTIWGDKSKLGTYSVGGFERNGMLVINAYTQYKYGRDMVYVDYDALRRVMALICEHWPDHRVISMPKIGAGLGGGNWMIIRDILQAVSNKYNTRFHVYLLDEEPPK